MYPRSSRAAFTVSTWYWEFGSAEQYRSPTVLASGKSSFSIAACWSRGARSEVPEILPPTVPSKSVRSRATPYSVTAVPRIGISLVPAAAARIRSTLLDTKLLMIVLHVAESPCAFCSSNVTFSSPRPSFTASSNPCVAASSASCWTNWQIPMLYVFCSSACTVTVPARPATIAPVRITDKTFLFIFYFLLKKYFRVLKCFFCFKVLPAQNNTALKRKSQVAFVFFSHILIEK